MLPHVPTSPEWYLDWDVFQQYEWIRRLKDCPQDPKHHAEGNVWIHQRMVLEALCEDADWRALSEADRETVFWAALLHDVAKPATTREENGRTRAPGHSPKGAVMARKILWAMGVPFSQRERICNMVRFHQVPFWLIERENPKRILAEISHLTRCDLLAILAKADLLGRICEDRDAILDNIELFKELAREQNCLDQPLPFCDAVTRYLYFRDRWSLTDIPATGTFKSKVTVMSGLPGSGKDTWLARHKPDLAVVSLDGIREELKISTRDNQSVVIAEAKERAKVYLRRGEDFAWNATNLGQRLRHGLLDFFDRYHAAIEVVYIESGPDRLWSQNENRESAIPASAINKLMGHWEPPDPWEGVTVHYNHL